MGNGVLNTPFGQWFPQARLLLDLLVIAWVIGVINFSLLGGSLNQFGLRPRKFGGLPGVFLMPLLHSNWEHLEGNSIFFLVFGVLIVIRDATDLPIVILSGTIIPGLIIWLIGKPRYYIGASGVVFAMIGFLTSLVYFTQDALAAIFLAVTTFFFSDKIWGLFPQEDGIAWECHLLGFASGIFAAYYRPELKALLQQITQAVQTATRVI